MNQNITPSNRIELSTTQYIGHYSFMLVPLIFPAFELFYKLRGDNMVNTFSTTTQIVFAFLSLLIGYFKWRELRYHEIIAERTDEEFKNSVLAASNRLNWSITKLDGKFAEAIGYNMWKSRDPQKITILRKANKVSINSIIEPGFFSVPDFFGINKTNRVSFINYYRKSNTVKDINKIALHEIKEEELRIENEPEWTLKNTLKRLVAYLFSLIFLASAIAIYRYEGFTAAVPIFAIIGIVYVVFDIYVLYKKGRNPIHKK
ncbi:MAG: hypothetical protein ACJA01_004067 [Saprospiraceae bacterium]